MKTTTILAALAGFTASVSAVALPATIASSDEIKVEVFPDGLPEDLIPQASGLVKRADNGVFLCTDRNFSGYCVHIVAPLYKCGMHLDPLTAHIAGNPIWGTPNINVLHD